MDQRERTFPTESASVGAARRWVTQLVDCSDAPRYAHTVGLLVSELASNVVRHTGSKSFSVKVTLGERVWVSVGDSNPSLGHGMQPPTHDDVRGRGLPIVDALADRWGVETLGEGKHVWFEVSDDS